MYVPDYRLDPPDWPEPREAARCAGCGKPIMEGDDYYEIPSEDAWCPQCVILKTA